MRKALSSLPENADGREGALLAQRAIESGWPKKKGLNHEDVYRMVQAIRAGASWEEAKQSAGWNIEDGALESWKDGILQRAGIDRSKPVLPEGVRAAAPIAEVVTPEEEPPASAPQPAAAPSAPRPRTKPPTVKGKPKKAGPSRGKR